MNGKAPPDTEQGLGAQGDDVYAALLEAHQGLSDEQSQRLNARLVLVLANRVGNAPAVIAAINDARSGIVPKS